MNQQLIINLCDSSNIISSFSIQKQNNDKQL